MSGFRVKFYGLAFGHGYGLVSGSHYKGGHQSKGWRHNTMLRSTNFWFFVILSLNFWLVPLLPEDEVEDLLGDGLMAFTLLAVVILQGLTERRFRHWAIVAGACIIAAIALEELLPGAAYIEDAAFAVCFAAATALYFHTMTQSLRRVTFDTVFAAVCTYILIGMFFAFVFGLIIQSDPEAFAPAGALSARYDQVYYSFATLTTLGAADVLPVSDAAKMMTVFEATTGLIYIAFLVGSIVGTFSAGLVARKSDQSVEE